MNWDEVGAIGQVAGAIVVALTLVYLALQTRQNSLALQGASRDSMAKSTMDICLAAAGGFPSTVARAVVCSS